jgi:hypothetical protein
MKLNNKFLLKLTLRVNFGKDVGQNFGSLFEATNAQGSVVAGAGFLGAYNTTARSNRRVLHFFVKPKDDAFTTRLLPRVNDDAGVYLSDFDGKLYARSYTGGLDDKLRFWDAAARQWVVDESTTPYAIHVADGVLAATAKRITYRGRPILEVSENIGQPYYANGFLFVRLHGANVNKLLACRWTTEDTAAIDPSKGNTLQLRSPNEFVYAYGQLSQNVVAATNTGGVYVFDGARWNVLREPNLSVSFQIYSIVNYDDRLLMGHYPTGNLYEYDGKDFRLLSNQPPVMKGVSTRAREAQTMAIYRGDLFVGVWPWGEVWRYDRDKSDWIFVARTFTHPEPTDKFVHPYEPETTALDPVLNRWGQRVTSLIPFGDSLFVSTSAKNSAPFEQKFSFLADDKWKEYGNVFQWTMPGHLSVHTEWKNAPTTFELTVTEKQMSVSQGGKLLGSVALDPKVLNGFTPKNIKWGEGVFGRLRGDVLRRTVNLKSSS